MARQGNWNSFALLDDEEGDDISNLIDRVSEKVMSSLPPTVEKKQKNRTDTTNLAAGHVQPSDSVKGEKGRGRGGRGRGRGRGAGRFGNGDDRANSYEQSHGGSDGHQRNYRGGNDYGGSDTYQRKYGGVDASQSENGGGRSYQRNNGGEDGYHKYGGVNGSQRNYGGDSAQNLGDDNWQGNGRGRGRGRGRERRSGFDETNAFGNEVEVNGSQQIQIQGGADSSGWEQVNEFEGNRHGNEGQSIRRDERLLKNGDHSSGNDRRGYTGGHSYGGRGGRNENGEFSNNSETKDEIKEDVDGEKGNAVNGDNSGEAEGKASLTTEVAADAESKQETVKDSSENVKEEEDNDMTLEEYEKVLLEKRKALEAMKNTVERKVILDKDFESMQLIEKKKEDSLFIKLNSDKDKLKKKEIFDKEEKVRKVANQLNLVSINEFLKPADGEMPMRTFARGRGGSGRGSGGNSRGRGERSGFRGAFSGQQGRGEASLPLEDPRQFPVLGGAVKV